MRLLAFASVLTPRRAVDLVEGLYIQSFKSLSILWHHKIEYCKLRLHCIKPFAFRAEEASLDRKL